MPLIKNLLKPLSKTGGNVCQRIASGINFIVNFLFGFELIQDLHEVEFTRFLEDFPALNVSRVDEVNVKLFPRTRKAVKVSRMLTNHCYATSDFGPLTY